MASSCFIANVRRYNVDSTVPQLLADLCSSLLIEVMIELVTIASIDGGGMKGDLLVAFACIGRPQFVEAFEVVRVEDVSSGANSAL